MIKRVLPLFLTPFFFFYPLMIFIFPNPALCQEGGLAVGKVEIASSPNPVGSGARALGMGGAFIGVADDATAASWNPGGLVQLKTPEVSMVVNGVHRVEELFYVNNPEANGPQSISDWDLNYLSAVYPFNLFDRNMILSLNYQNLYDFDQEWRFPLTTSQQTPFGALRTDVNVHSQKEGTLSAIGLAYCIQIIPELSFGFTLNFWDDDLTENEWKSLYRAQGSSGASVPGFSSTFRFQTIDRYAFSGFNFNLGMLYRSTDRLTIGAVFKSHFTADLKHYRQIKSDLNGMETLAVEETVDEEMEMPMSYGIGLAYRFSDALTLSADLYRTEWDDMTITDDKGEEFSLFTGMPAESSDIDATHQIRFGAEYLLIRPNRSLVFPFRAGFFYDPAPAQGNPDDYYGFSLGSGIAAGKMIFDMAYQFRYGNDVGTSLVPDYQFSEDVEEHLIYSSFIFHF